MVFSLPPVNLRVLLVPYLPEVNSCPSCNDLELSEVQNLFHFVDGTAEDDLYLVVGVGNQGHQYSLLLLAVVLPLVPVVDIQARYSMKPQQWVVHES